MRAPALIIAAGLSLGGCIIAPPITGDGCPWGGCRAGPTQPPFEAQTVLPTRDPFVEGGHFRLGRVNVRLTADQLSYRSPTCDYEAVRAGGPDVPAPETWRTPTPSIRQVYRIVTIAEDCSSGLQVGERLIAVAVGRNWAPGRVNDRLWLGSVTPGSQAQILDRR